MDSKGKALLPLDMDYLTPEMIKRAEKELGETKERKNETIVQMRKKIRDDPRLSVPEDDEYLLSFLRNRKFNVQKAVAQLAACVNLRTNMKFLDPNFEAFKEAVKKKITYPLLSRDKDGAAVMVMQLRNWDVSVHDIEFVIRAVANLGIACNLMFPATQICGLKILVDAKSVGLRHVKYLTPKYIKLLTLGTTNTFPVRICGIHILNEGMFVQYVWNVAKFWVSDKMTKRIHFHGENKESLLSHFPASILPLEFGGSSKIDVSGFLQKLEDTKERYQELWSTSYKSRRKSSIQKIMDMIQIKSNK